MWCNSLVPVHSSSDKRVNAVSHYWRKESSTVFVGRFSAGAVDTGLYTKHAVDVAFEIARLVDCGESPTVYGI